MIIPIKCFTCGKVLADKYLYYIKEVRRIKLTNNIFGYDPVVSEEDLKKFDIKPVGLEEGFNQADCGLIMNNHSSYSTFDIYSLLSKPNKPSMFLDGWNTFGRKVIEKIDHIDYETI